MKYVIHPSNLPPHPPTQLTLFSILANSVYDSGFLFWSSVVFCFLSWVGYFYLLSKIKMIDMFSPFPAERDKDESL